MKMLRISALILAIFALASVAPGQSHQHPPEYIIRIKSSGVSHLRVEAKLDNRRLIPGRDLPEQQETAITWYVNADQSFRLKARVLDGPEVTWEVRYNADGQSTVLSNGHGNLVQVNLPARRFK